MNPRQWQKAFTLTQNPPQQLHGSHVQKTGLAHPPEAPNPMCNSEKTSAVTKPWDNAVRERNTGSLDQIWWGGDI
jgi:hypothetical protein